VTANPHFPAEPVPLAAARRPSAPTAALLGLGVLALAGAWLIAAPFLLGYHGLGDQRRGLAWTDSTRVDVSLGSAILAVSVAALLGYLAAAVTWLARYRQAE
jgi:hypothetical protein